MKRVFIFASMAMASGLMLANVYTSLVDARSWGSHFPDSILVARQYYHTVTPGAFFRIFSPLNQVLGLLGLLLFWKRGGKIRWLLGLAFLLYFTAEGLTFKYFYPRNDILFTSDVTDTEKIRAAWQQWSGMNWVRTLLLLGGFVCSSIALHHTYLVPKRKTGSVPSSRTALPVQ